MALSAFETELERQLDAMLCELARRGSVAQKLDTYYEGCSPLPDAIVRAGVTKAYRLLMPMAEAPWGSLIVDSVQDRLEVAGITDVQGNDAATEAVWGVWQENQMDSESLLAHNSTLVNGRAFALVWPGDDGRPEITLDNAEQMIVMYRPGSRRVRLAALRCWLNDYDRGELTLYRPEALYKYREVRPEDRVSNALNAGGKLWGPRATIGRDGMEEPWPLPNPYGFVPAVELPVNRRLKAGPFSYARGEYQHCTGLIDRINLLTFLGLVVAFWMGFPLRGVIGDKIIRDDEGNPLAPFDVNADKVFQLEDPQAKLAEFKAADRGNLSVFAELDQLATITKTPRHYFPMQNGMSNLSADAIRASEGGLVAKIPVHHGSLGEGWEEVLRLAGLMLPSPVVLSPRAELQWRDHETRSMAERADAATKLKDILPWQVIAEKVLNATSGEINRWSAMRTSDGFGQLLAAAATTANGAGAGAAG